VNSYKSLLSLHAKENRAVCFAARKPELISNVGADGVVPDTPSLLETVKRLCNFPDVSLARRFD
jgi:hypothetical protein